jgi:hypothetical protein
MSATTKHTEDRSNRKPTATVWTSFDTPLCGCAGCHESADYVIDHPEYGERTVCTDHAADHPVVREVER